MAAVCQKCGVTGYANLLIFCSICKTSAEHQYCLDEIPGFDVVTHWSCQQCKPRRAKFASISKLNIVKGQNAKLLSCQLGSDSDAVNPCLKKRHQRILSGAKSAHGAEWLGDITNDQEDMVANDSDVTKEKISSYEKIVLPQKEKENELHLPWKGDSDEKLKINRKRPILSEVEQPSESEDDIPITLLLQAKTGFDNSKKLYQTRNIKLSDDSDHHKQLQKCNAPFVANEKPKHKRRRLIIDEEDESVEEAQVDLLGKNDHAGDDQQASKHSSTLEDYTQKPTTKLTAQSIALDEVMPRSQVSSSKAPNLQPIVQSENCDAQLSTSSYPESVNWPVQPISQYIWSGCFMIGNKEYGPLTAHLSTTACEKVWNISKTLPAVINLIKLPRLVAWPKSFETSPPNDDNIGLFFFPFDREYKWLDEVVDQLLGEVINKDLVLKFELDEAELLVFPSVILPKDSHRFHGRCYLWGVFKARQVVSCNMIEEERDQQASGHKDEGKVETCQYRLFDAVESSTVAETEKEVENDEDSSTSGNISKQTATSTDVFSTQIGKGSSLLVSCETEIPFAPKLVEFSSREKKETGEVAEDCPSRKVGEAWELGWRTEAEQEYWLEVSDHSQVTDDSEAHYQEYKVRHTDDGVGMVECLSLFPEQVEDLGFRYRGGRLGKELNLELGLS